MKTYIPYGREALPLCLSQQAEILEAHLPVSTQTADELIARAMEAPIDSARLEELAKGKAQAVILCSDHTRPVPSRHIIPPMLRALRAGNPDIEIILLIATGCHRCTGREELIAKFGEEIVEQETILVHDCDDTENLIEIGILPSGAPLIVNRLAAQTPLLLAEGFIEPHFFAGFSGGRKSVLPGICARETVMGNHCADFIDSPYARAGELDRNPIHKDMQAAARMIGLQYIINVVLDAKKQVIYAVAGHPETAHRTGCDWLQAHCGVACTAPGDIVITSNGGAPLDQNLYQAVKGLYTAEAAAAAGAVLVICAECADGIGGDHFYHAVADAVSPQALLDEIRKIPMAQTRIDQWQYQILVRIMVAHTVILVSEPQMRPIAEKMGLLYAENAQQALQMAYAQKGEQAHVVVIPDGISVIVK